MGYHERFEWIFRAAHQRSPAAAMPGYVGSPMDDRTTITVARALVDACQAAAEKLLDPELEKVARGQARAALRPAAG
jgi:hypothetical protein